MVVISIWIELSLVFCSTDKFQKSGREHLPRELEITFGLCSQFALVDVFDV